ncbi:hypothetical protein [Neptunicella sp.]|uniref:hypothetical protein n=1 Tax=Neptunicella sp. TaxID=2125986 RepID=UPI003F68EE67
MLTKVKTTIAILGISLFASTAVQAQEFDMQKVSSELMEQAVKLVDQQLQQQLEKATFFESEPVAEMPELNTESEVVLHTEDAPVTVAVNVE